MTPVLGRRPGAGVLFEGRRVLRIGAITIGGVLALLLPFAGAHGAAPARLPDLGISPLKTPLIERTVDDRRRLRFTVSIANVGKGPIEVVGARLTLGSPFLTWQQIQRADSTSYRVELPKVGLVFAGTDLHGHWHIRGAARYELRKLEDGAPVRLRMKRGFCLFDSTAYRRSIPGAPAKAAFTKDGCGSKSALRLAMGVSIGWKDDYYWRIPGQVMDITDLPHGKYRLYTKVDPRNWFHESNDRNNEAWIDIEISDSLLVKVLGRSPAL